LIKFNLALEQQVEPSLFDIAIATLSPFMWNSGKTQLSLPIEQIREPDPEWGARKKNKNHIKVNY